jgi:hypothetical protein
MNLAVIARAFLNHTDLFQHFINGPHAGRRVLHVDSVAKGELVADALAHKLAPNGALEDALVELEDALERVVVGPGGYHPTHRHALVLQVDGDGPALPVGIVYLLHHALYVVLVEKNALVVVAHPLGIGGAPEQHPSVHGWDWDWNEGSRRQGLNNVHSVPPASD